jgi:hypothetical protein
MVKPVTVELRGGLGNQLFCWATGMSLAIERDLPIVFSTRFANLTLDIADLDVYLPVREPGRFTQAYQRSKFLRKFAGTTGFLRVISEAEYEFDDSGYRLHPGQTLRGHFQSPKYFDGNRAEILRMATQLKSKSSDFLKISRELDERNWVAIHVRGGDYFNHQDYFSIVGSDYYRRAIVRFRDEGIADFVVFTNDEQYARSLEIFERYTMITQNTLSAAESLILGSSARGLVGTNSTFSWWMGYLMVTENMKLFPYGWFVKEGLSETQLFPQDFAEARNFHRL